MRFALRAYPAASERVTNRVFGGLTLTAIPPQGYWIFFRFPSRLGFMFLRRARRDPCLPLLFIIPGEVVASKPKIPFLPPRRECMPAPHEQRSDAMLQDRGKDFGYRARGQ